jgi:XTP/dITP diphosphohydrolase
MCKIKEIIIGTNNAGKYEEICDLLPGKIKKISPKEFKIKSPEETGKSFEKNAFIKASYYSKKTNMICLSDDSGLEIDILNGQPGIYSSRWSGEKDNFNLAIKKIYKKMKQKNKDWKENSSARFICCMTIFWPDGKSYTSRGIIKGKISIKKKGKNGFGYDPIFIPNGYERTFSEMRPKLKMSIDHRSKAFYKIRKFFN